jgi:hypothetical protein
VTYGDAPPDRLVCAHPFDSPVPLLRYILHIVPVALAIVLLGSSPSTAFSQRADSLRVGARVRVETRHMYPRSLIGVLEAADSARIAVAPDGRPTVLFHYSEIETIAVGRREARPGGVGRGAKRGFLFGLGTTIVAAGVASAVAHAIDYKPSEYSPSVPLTVAILGVPFTAFSTAVGALIGSTDRTVWQPVWSR